MKISLTILGFFLLTIISSTTSIKAQSALNQSTNPLRFVIYYDGDFDNMLQKGSKLMSFLEAYSLEVVNTFEIDKDHKGFTIEDRKGHIINPQDLAREASMYAGVIAVEVIQQSPQKLVI